MSLKEAKIRAVAKASSPVNSISHGSRGRHRGFEAHLRGWRGPGRCSPGGHGRPSWEACWATDNVWILGDELADVKG